MWNADRGAYLNMFSGKTICTGSDDATLRIWNPKSGENIHVIRGHPYHTDGLTCLAISSDSTLAFTGSKDNSVHMVNITTRKEGVSCLTWFGTSRFLATGCVDGKVRIWDSLSGDYLRASGRHSNVIQALSVSVNRDFLVSVSLDGTPRVFEVVEFQ